MGILFRNLDLGRCFQSRGKYCSKGSQEIVEQGGVLLNERDFHDGKRIIAHSHKPKLAFL